MVKSVGVGNRRLAAPNNGRRKGYIMKISKAIKMQSHKIFDKELVQLRGLFKPNLFAFIVFLVGAIQTCQDFHDFPEM